MTADRKRSDRKIVVTLVAVVVFMFGFGYALVPLYDTFCVAFGLNGKTGTTDAGTAAEQGVDRSRRVMVQFTSHTASGLPWEFMPGRQSIEVHPGEVMDATYLARNLSSLQMVGRATYSVSPPEAAVHFKKTDCFCFTNQLLDGNESKQMPVRFVIDRSLPEDISTVTLSYTFFNAEKYLSESDREELAAGRSKHGSGADRAFSANDKQTLSDKRNKS